MDLAAFLKFPLSDKDWVKKIIIGCVITLVPVLNLLTLGYLLNCLQLGMQGRAELPEWQDWGELIKDGFFVLLIIIVYLLIPLILFPLLSFIPIIGTIIASILLLLAGLLLPAALASYSIKRDLTDALQVKVIYEQTTAVMQYYLPAYVAMVVVCSFCFLITGFIPLVSFIGVLLLFYASVVFFNLIGQLFYGSRYN
ncbi:MAG TPA: DUF4013 domain-containing protein [Syntrophomonadaceae bacterium]|nr:DUF4013 domain-containing protein [Syntrophomonadaceae bacterium]HPR92683.1 DUF4013 domain-containing protein [Syntrophomonadaceae bacterium]